MCMLWLIVCWSLPLCASSPRRMSVQVRRRSIGLLSWQLKWVISTCVHASACMHMCVGGDVCGVRVCVCVSVCVYVCVCGRVINCWLLLVMCSCLPLYEHCSVLCAHACFWDVQYTDLFLTVSVYFAVYVIVTVSSLLTTVGQGTWIAAEESVGAEPNDTPTDTNEVWLLNSFLTFLVTICSF